MDRRRRFHRRETWTARYATSTTDEVRCHLSNGMGSGRSDGDPRPQSTIPETTTLIVTKVRIASDAKRRNSCSTRGWRRMSCASIRVIRRRRWTRWTTTRPANASPTSAWMAFRMRRSCRVPSAAARRAKRPRCTSQRDLSRHVVRDRVGPSVGARTVRPRVVLGLSVSNDVTFQSGYSPSECPALACAPRRSLARLV